jgi:hypothetical protein
MPLARPFVSFPEWTPDRPRYQRGLGKATNCYPRTQGTDGSISYGPYPAPQPYSDALPGRCVGGFSARSLAGNVSIFAATATGIYRFSGGWTDVSGAVYTTPPLGFWEFCQFGEFVIATNFADPVQVFQLDVSGTFANLGGSPPKAKHIAVIEPGFVVLGHLDVAGTVYPNGVQWSAYNNHANWPTPGTSAAGAVQSDRNILPFGGWVQRIVGPVGGASGAVFMDAAIFRMEYAQPPLVFRFIGTVPMRGCQAPFSVVLVAVKNSQTVALFVGDDGIHAFDGTSTQPIGANKVDQYVLSLFSSSYRANICAMTDSTRNLAFWLIPDQGGFSTRLICFNWDLAAFSELQPVEMQGSPGTSPGAFGPLELMTIGYTTDGLDVLATPTDQLTFPMDNRVWTGGAMAGPGYFDSENRLNYFIGPSMAAEIDTGQIDGGNGKRLFCGGIRPITDEPVAANISTQIVYSDVPNLAGTATSPAFPAADGVCPHRISARYMSARVRLAAGASWTHLQGVEPRIRPEGRR